MNLLVNRDITIFERAQASSDDTWLVVAIVIVCFISLCSAILERSKLLQRSLIENEVASRLRAKETLDKYEQKQAEDAKVSDAAAAPVTEKLPTFDEVSEMLRLKREAEAAAGVATAPRDGEAEVSPMELASDEHAAVEPTTAEMFPVTTSDGRTIMIPKRGPDVPEYVSDQDWIDLKIWEHDNR